MRRIEISLCFVMKFFILAIVWIYLIGTAAWGASTSESSWVEVANHFVNVSGAAGGICSVVESTDANLPSSLSKQGPFIVHCLHKNRQECNKMRQEIRSLGWSGKVSAGTYENGFLPYMQNLINIVVVDSYPLLANKELIIEEVKRVLTPLGTAFIGTSSNSELKDKWIDKLKSQLHALGMVNISVIRMGGTWVKATNPWPNNIDEWTHYLHGADGNPVAKDRVVAPPEHYQWTGRPMWMRSHETDSSISTLVTAKGRLFYIEDQAPISLAGNHSLPDKWFLVARDAFNGVILWKVPIRRWGWREWKSSWFSPRPLDIPLNIQKRLVAIGDKVYVTLGYHAPVSELDARTGKILQTYTRTEPTGEILYLNGTLILSVLKGNKVKVMSLDAATGKKHWISENAYSGSTVDYIRWRAMRGSIEPAKLDPSLNMATDGKVVALLEGADIVVLDFKTGKEKWRATFPQVEADQNAGGINTKGNLWIGTMIVKHGVVIHASPNNMAGFSADTGELLWTQPKKYIGHLWYEWKDVFVIDGLVWTWGADLERSVLANSGKKKQKSLYPKTVKGYDIKTGELKRKVDLGFIFKTHHHHRCYRNKATSRYILASRRGTEYVDLQEGYHTVHNWVRGTCHVGMMPANGLQYAPSHPCVCYINEKINGMNALAPAGSVEQETVSNERMCLQKGPVYDEIRNQESKQSKPSDCPTYRCDTQRTGSVNTKVPYDLEILWSEKVGQKVSPPIVVGNLLFTSLIDEHYIVCLNVKNGQKVWEYAAGARIDSPPTYYKGTVIFGSADGYVYCLRARDGQLVWRFFAAPGRRLIGAFGQLESAWPVHGSILVQDGIAYFAAGRSSHLDGGIYVYGIDATTGKVCHKTHFEGPSYTVDNLKENYKMPMGALTDILISDGEKIFMHAETFDLKLNRKGGRPKLKTRSGFLEDSYFKRTPWRSGGEYARLIVRDKRSVYYARMFDSLQGLNPSVYFTPDSKGYLLFAKNMRKMEKDWRKRVPVRIRAMILARKHLFVAGPPDVLDSKDPLGAFEARKGGLLYVIDTDRGKKLSEYKLPSPPVFNGAVAANSRLYVTLENGTIICFGKR